MSHYMSVSIEMIYFIILLMRETLLGLFTSRCSTVMHINVRFVCMQRMQDELSNCDEMLNAIQESVAGEENVDDELLQVRRRHTNLTEKTSRLFERISRAVQLRESYWTRRSSLETCLEDCRHQMSSLDRDNVDVDAKVAQLEASCCAM